MRVNQAHKNKPQVLDLNPQLYSFPPSRYFEVFKDQTHSVWCFVYTVWCHHTNLARQFVPRSIMLLGAEDRFSNIRFLSRRHSETLMMTRAVGTSISTQNCKGRVADAGALLLLTGQTHMRDKSKTQTKPVLQMGSLSTCLMKWLKCSSERRKPLITARRRGVKFKIKWKQRQPQWGNPSTLYLDYMEMGSTIAGEKTLLIGALLNSVGVKRG